MLGKGIPMSQLRGDTTVHKESTSEAGHRTCQEEGKTSSKMVARLYGNTEDAKETVSPPQGEEKPRPMSEACVCGDPTDPEASTKLYVHAKTNRYDEKKESESVMYQAGMPLNEDNTRGDQTGGIFDVTFGSTLIQAAGTRQNLNDSMRCHDDTASPGSDMSEEPVNCNPTVVVTTEMLNPAYNICSVQQGEKEEGTRQNLNDSMRCRDDTASPSSDMSEEPVSCNPTVVITTEMLNPAYKHMCNVQQGETEEDGNDVTVNSNPTKERISQRRPSSTHDVPQATSGRAAMDEGDRSCFKRMFATTFSRLTCALIMAAIIMSVVTLAVVVIKSNSKLQPPVSPTDQHHPSHWSTPLVTSSPLDEYPVPPTMSAEPTEGLTTIKPPRLSAAMSVYTTPTDSGLQGTKSTSIPPTKRNRICGGRLLLPASGSRQFLAVSCASNSRKYHQEEQKKEKQPSQQDDKQAEIESVQEVESGVQEPAEMLMEVETVYRSWFDGGLTMCQYLNRRDERGKRPGDLGAWASQGEESTEVSPVTSSKRKTTLNYNVEDRKKAKRERERKRYQEDEKYAQAQRDRKKTRYHTDEEHAQAERDRKKERYHTDEEHAQAERDRKKERYHTDEEHAQETRDKTKERYHTDEEHAQEKRDKTKERYHTDEEHAQEKRDKTKERYHIDEEHAQEKRDYEKERGQKGVIGPVVCVPADVSETHAVLPRMPTEAELIKVKLKRKLQYSGRYMYRQISPMKVDAALKYLVENNELYSGTSINADWALSWNEEGLLEPGGEGDSEVPTVPEHGESVSEDSDGVEGPTGDGMEDDEMDNILQQMNIEEAIEEADLAEDEELDNLLRGLPHDTCLQPIDIGQEFLDHHDEHILCVAPGQGEKPVSVFKEVGGEAMSFPVQFPTGKFSFNDDRNVSIKPSKYFKARLMGADTRFASDTSYIFFAQYVTELHFIQSNISISMRKGSPVTSDGRRISAGMLSNREDLQNILKSDQGYRFLQPVRGTPQFWDRALNELFAMIRQLGIPTWFATFSAEDLRWPEVLEAIRQDQSSVPVSDLSWEERCDILKSNPVTAARMFDHRVKLFFKHLIQSPSQQIGEVVDTLTRTEFQQRGSPHIHCLFWVKDAPKLDVNSEEEICSFVDRYVSCQLPNAETDKELFDIVSQVQMHRKGHTASCKKGGKVCRFGFPKPPVKQTFLCGPTPLTEMTFEELASIPAREAQAEAILKAFWDVLNKKSEPEKCSTDDLLKEVKITTAQFCVAMNTMANRKQIMLRREPKDMWVNNYNPHLLRAWNANMDIQYVLDAYSCVKYIVSYISKAEREMGKLLKQAHKEAREGNEDVVTEMRKVGHAYIHHREVSAQEAVYRVCSLKLKDCSREVIFIPTDEHANRLSKPLAAIKQLASQGDEASIWMPSIMDRYKARPREEPFRSLCAAEFASEYRVVSCSGKQNTYSGEQPSRGEAKHALRDDLGVVQKRTRSKPAVIRFAKFNKEKEPERYYLTLLKLYLPHYCDAELKPPQFEKYEEFYSDGVAPLSNTNDKVKVVVHANRRKFEQNVDELEQARKDVENNSCLVEDVWAQMFPEIEQERIECQNMRGENEVNNEGQQDDIPDLPIDDKSKEKSFTLEACQTQVPSEMAIPMLQSLNPKQQEVFYFVRKWCMETAQGKRPDPFHIFLTGGAGTGKSHLIKCICYEATRLLQQTQENPDSVSVLLAAPTGTAAFNIGGSTIHHAFHLMCKAKDREGLSECTVNTMRAQYESLKIVIVDEVSMVDKTLMKSIHLRLRQLRQGRPNALFGNVSILAVGDMYQVPPVRGISLYKERDRDIYDLWNPNFEVVELEEIMRQKDDAAFAKLLNRMRVKRKKDKLSDEDDEILSSRVLSVDFEADDYPKDALHIFTTNIAVAEHNNKMLRLRCPDVRCFEASDFVKDPTTGSMKRRDLARGGKDDLPDVVKVGVGARVMLSRNVNVADGLVNGAFGTVSGVAGGQDDAREVATVFVQFDNPKVQLESFNMFRKDRSGRHVSEDGSSATSNAPYGGVAVYVRDVYRCSEIPIPDDIVVSEGDGPTYRPLWLLPKRPGKREPGSRLKQLEDCALNIQQMGFTREQNHP
ncbi:hypothetical protein Bbelb_241400 [Branchiostoma belcheri]|nr:hypothetical protein Bbelb_241400 [Branchiostoma belcheri]